VLHVALNGVAERWIDGLKMGTANGVYNGRQLRSHAKKASPAEHLRCSCTPTRGLSIRESGQA
jgi:hypothetical protein